VSKGGFATKRDAQRALTEALSSVASGKYVLRSKMTLGQYLEDEWLPAIRTTIRPTTHEHYTSNVRAHIVPRLGGLVLQDLSPAQLNRFYGDLLVDGRRQGKGGLSPKSVRHIHTLIRKALHDATRWGIVSRNVADLADPPKPSVVEMKVWEPEQIRAFLSCVDGDRLYALWHLMATTGMRRGEVVGLRWGDVDLSGGRLSIVRAVVSVEAKAAVSEPKTKRGRRSIALDQATVDVLRRHRAAQAAEKLAWGEAYEDHDLVSAWENGRPIHPHRISTWFERTSRETGLPRIRLHDLRHSYATAALKAGVPAKVVSERLGHANVTITLDTYSHVLPGMDESAAETVAAIIFDG
jgi:integrase